MKFICPLVVVTDIKRSRFFYETLLKQQVKVDFGENIAFHGDFSIHLDSHFKQLISKDNISYGGNNFELYFENINLEEIVNTLKEHDVIFIHDIREQPWRQKVVRFYDPDKNIIEIGEPMEFLAFRLFKEGYGIEQISKTTYLPDNIIQAAIEQYSSENGNNV